MKIRDSSGRRSTFIFQLVELLYLILVLSAAKEDNDLMPYQEKDCLLHSEEEWLWLVKILHLAKDTEGKRFLDFTILCRKGTVL